MANRDEWLRLPVLPKNKNHILTKHLKYFCFFCFVHTMDYSSDTSDEEYVVAIAHIAAGAAFLANTVRK